MILIVLIAVAILVLGTYLKNEYIVVREITIRRSKQEVLIM